MNLTFLNNLKHLFNSNIKELKAENTRLSTGLQQLTQNNLALVIEFLNYLEQKESYAEPTVELSKKFSEDREKSYVLRTYKPVIFTVSTDKADWLPNNPYSRLIYWRTYKILIPDIKE
jgi:hypothetical protein